MTLNKWLCKHLDNDRKGYVTINDLGNEIFRLLHIFIIYLLLGVLITGVLYSMYLLSFGKIEVFALNTLHDLIGFIGIIGFFITTVVYIIGMNEFIFTPLSKVKIAKCELKEDSKD